MDYHILRVACGVQVIWNQVLIVIVIQQVIMMMRGQTGTLPVTTNGGGIYNVAIETNGHERVGTRSHDSGEVIIAKHQLTERIDVSNVAVKNLNTTKTSSNEINENTNDHYNNRNKHYYNEVSILFNVNAAKSNELNVTINKQGVNNQGMIEVLETEVDGTMRN